MFKKLRARIREYKLTMRLKLVLSLASIAVILLVSSFISIMEYSRMSSYVSELIGANIGSINAAQKLADSANGYNMDILSVIGDGNATSLPAFSQTEFVAYGDSLKASLEATRMLPLADSVLLSYTDYLIETMEFEDIMALDSVDVHQWYFETLQPKYDRLHSDINALNAGIYKELQKNSATFDRGFYRSVIPGAVAVAVGLLLVLLLLFFLMVYYVNPVYKMLKGLRNYRSLGTKYTCSFDGDDELSELNDGVTELVGENIQLRKRIKTLRDKQ